MADNLYEALEVCIRALETGADLETVLKLYPQMEKDLRPILETMQRAQSLSVSDVPDIAFRRGRARVLQRAAELREPTRKPRRRSRFTFTRFATSLALAFVLLLGGTSMVSASSGALPGDNLYPVKRGWETVRLWFSFSPEGREELESEYEQERLNEADELLNEGREEVIAFYGIVTAQDGDYWLVSSVPVQLTANTQLPADQVTVGAPVTIVGRTNTQGFIEASMVGMLGPGVSLPPLKPELEAENQENESEEYEANEDARYEAEEHNYQTFEFRGVVTSQQGTIWMINGQEVDVSRADILGNITVGSFVKLKGYYGQNQNFVVIEIELKEESKINGELVGNSSSVEKTDNNNDGSNSESVDNQEKSVDKEQEQEDAPSGGSSSENDEHVDEPSDESGDN